MRGWQARLWPRSVGGSKQPLVWSAHLATRAPRCTDQDVVPSVWATRHPPGPGCMMASMETNGKQRDPLPKIQVVSDAEAEEADAVICMPIGATRYFDDDIETVCADCGQGIFHRPHVPKKPRKICIDCAAKLPPE